MRAALFYILVMAFVYLEYQQISSSKLKHRVGNTL